MRAIAFAALFLAASTAHAQSAAHDKLLAQFKSGEEKTARDALWTNSRTFKVGVLDNGTPRDGYADYVCQEANALGLKGISVQIIDVAKLKRTGNWTKLGEKHCD